MKKTLLFIFLLGSIFAQNVKVMGSEYNTLLPGKNNFLRVNSDGSSDVFIQDYTTPAFHYFLMREDKTDITLVDTVTIGESTFIASAGHGFTGTGEFASIFDNERYTQVEIASVSADTITVKSPFAYAFTPASTVVRGVVDMNVDADTTAQEFVFNFRNGTTPIDVQTINVSLQHATAADDSKFGDLAALTNGVYFRIEDGMIFNLGNYSINQDFKDFGAVVTYADKAGGGSHSTVAKFDIKNIYGVVFRIDPSTSTIFKARVRDDLSTLERFRVPLMGQFTSGE